MIQKNTEIKCNCCGKVFWTEYYHGGSIEHENYTKDHNMNIFVQRFKNESERFSKDSLFKDSIMLDGGFCNIKKIDYTVGLEIFECRIIWLRKNKHNDIADYLESRRKDIENEFNLITKQKIKEHEDAILNLKEKLI